METEKFNQFINSIGDGFIKVSQQVSDVKFAECARSAITEERKYSVIIGVTGKNNGRILLEGGANTIKAITESMNDGPFGNIMDMYLCLAEFANMFCGNAVTMINNKYRGTELRLTPPAVFGGVGMVVTTPNIHSASTYYSSEHGVVILDIGFEGV